jgi:hypothetical protein
MPAPYIRGKRYIDWDLPDPKGQPLEAVRALRDDIKARVESLAADSRRNACGRAAALGRHDKRDAQHKENGGDREPDRSP